MRISEIFLSIEGEGIRTGQTSQFIRFHGCSLNCSYCDSKYACKGSDYTEMTADEIWDALSNYDPCPRVTVTGGEPLLRQEQIDLIAELSRYYIVNVETNGHVPIKPLLDNPHWNIYKTATITMDWKSISSGESEKMNKDNLHLLTNQDVLKFVVSSEEDLDQMRDMVHYLDEVNTAVNIYVSPVFGTIDPKDIVDYVIKNKLHRVTTQLQLHKLIWSPDMRGV